LADGGTLFLDEIAELPLAAQAKLLRVLQGGVFERVGGSETVKVDARVVAATHRDLARRVERSQFREDLFYRLNVFRVDVPPLRERREDLRELVEYLHAGVARRLARAVLPISERSMRRVMAYRWPGNIRELANAVERATLLADGPELEIELPEAPGPGAGEGHSREARPWHPARYNSAGADQSSARFFWSERLKDMNPPASGARGVRYNSASDSGPKANSPRCTFLMAATIVATSSFFDR
jgi:DNA-binding NtrC family response regulator